MAISLNINGQTYLYPETGDVAWGPDATDWAVAVTSGMLQKAGGLFQLLAEVDFGSAYGLKSLYLKSRATNPSTTGIIRLGNTETVAWRNAANSADLGLTVSASNVLTFNSNPILTLALGTADYVLKMNSGGTAFEWGLLANANIDAAAAIVYSKLNLAASIVNADINASAAIAYSKLNLASSIVNADVNASAAIAYSKLNLSGSIVNADVNASAAIAYSKLNLTGTIVNADLSASADIAFGKLSATTCTIDEDNMASNSDVRLPTQQSVKAYVDTSIASAGSVETVNTTPITSTTTIGTSSASVRVCSSASAFNLTLDNTFAQGRNMTIENIGTNEVTLKANDTTTICTIYRKTRCRIVNLASTPTTNTSWMVITPIVSPPIVRTADFTFTNFGTVANPFVTLERKGKKAIVNGRVIFGTIPSATQSLDLPSGIAIDTNVYTTQTNSTKLGLADHLRTTSGNIYSANASAIFYDGSTAGSIFFALGSGATTLQYTKAAGTGFWAGNGSGIAFQCEFYVAAWEEFSG